MSRTKDDGLLYFPLDVGFFKDERIRRLAGRFGAEGPLLYVYVLCRIYENGFAIERNEDFIEDAAIDVRCSTEKIGLMLEYLLSRSLLTEIRVDKSLGSVTYLTSHGIQAQYQKSAKGKKRDIDVDAAVWILDSSETESFIKVRSKENNSEKKAINPGIKAINPGVKPQSKGKESKEKQSKGKSLTPQNAAKDGKEGQAELPFDGELREAVLDWLAYKKERRESYKPTGLKSLVSRIQNYANQFGDAETAGAIRDSMASNYAGIVFDRIGRTSGDDHKKKSTSKNAWKTGEYGKGYFNDDD